MITIKIMISILFLLQFAYQNSAAHKKFPLSYPCLFGKNKPWSLLLIVKLPGPSCVSATFPLHRSPCKSDGFTSTPLKNSGILDLSLDHSSLASVSLYCHQGNCVLLLLVKEDLNLYNNMIQR